MPTNRAKNLAPARRVVVTPDGAHLFMARVYRDHGKRLLDPQEVRLAQVKVWPYHTEDEVRQLSLRPDQVLLSGLQVDDDWTVDREGYNLRYRLPANLTRLSGQVYFVEFNFTLLGDTAEVPVYLQRETFEVLSGPALQ